MAEHNQNFQVFAGNDKKIFVTITDIETISASEIKWLVKNSAGDVVIQKSKGDGITLDGSVVEITLDSADTLNLNLPYRRETIFDHELLITDNNNKTSTTTRGKMSVLQSIAQKL